MKIQGVRGTNDLRPGPIAKEPEFEIHRWQAFEGAFRQLAHSFGYQEIRTPMFEEYDLFVRTSGETSDVVSKEMYDFRDKGDRHIALRPEGTAPVVRSYVEHSVGASGAPVRLYYIGPMFRYGRPQRGRYRQLHQAGLELIGPGTADADVEVIEMSYQFYRHLGLTDLEVELNSIGQPEDRVRYGEALLAHLDTTLRDQGDEARERARRNPLRLPDSKDHAIKAALADGPVISKFLSETARARFDSVLEGLAEVGIPFVVSPNTVRGLDYYSDTVFEISSTRLGAQDALCGGGRYDGLVQELGGQPTPSFGVGMGIERALIVQEQIGAGPSLPSLDVFFVLDEAAMPTGRALLREWRDQGVSGQCDVEGKGIKQQFKLADRLRARFTVIIRDEEMATNTVTLVDRESGGQQRFAPGEALGRVLSK